MTKAQEAANALYDFYLSTHPGPSPRTARAEAELQKALLALDPRAASVGGLMEEQVIRYGIAMEEQGFFGGLRTALELVRWLREW